MIIKIILVALLAFFAYTVFKMINERSDQESMIEDVSSDADRKDVEHTDQG